MPKNASFNLLETTGNITFTVIPNHFLDTIAPTLNPSELRVMLYIYRHTLGFQKLTDTISYDQFQHGLVTHNRRCLDKGAGVSRNSLVAALASLEKRLLIRRQHNGKYGPVTIKVQPAALHGVAEVDTGKPACEQAAPVDETPVYSRETAKEPAPARTSPGKALKAKTTRQTADQKLDRVTVTAFLDHLNQDQILTESENCEAQKLDFTKETGIQKQNKPNHNRTAAAHIKEISNQITANVPGISTPDAVRLVEHAFANGRDRAYFSRIIGHVTNNPAIRVPAAVLTALVKSNEDRVQLDYPEALRAGSKEPVSWNFPAGKKFKSGRALSAGHTSPHPRIDFGKYQQLSTTLPGDLPAADTAQATYSSQVMPEGRQGSGGRIDPHLKYSLQEFDNRLSVYVRHLAVEDTTLKIGFFGAKRFPAAELTAWLSRVKIYYPEVTAIQVIDQ